MWGSSSGAGTPQTVPSTGDSVILDAATCVGGTTCTITIDQTVTVISIVQNLCTASTTGCILDNSGNHPVTLSGTNIDAFSSTGSGTRSVICGTNTWTLSGANAGWSIATSTNLTFTCSTGTIAFTGVSTGTATGRALLNGGTSQAFGTVHFNANRGAQIAATTGITFAALQITGPNSVRFPAGVTTTITGAFAWTGTSTNQIFVESQSAQALATITTGSGTTNTAEWAAFWGITFVPVGGSTLAATNSFSAGLNSGTGFTITAPATGGGGSRCIGC